MFLEVPLLADMNTDTSSAMEEFSGPPQGNVMLAVYLDLYGENQLF